MFVMLFSAQIIAAPGFGTCFPYSVPACTPESPTPTRTRPGH
ncbi:hypothetical protein [Nonomuraea sp. GTA35]